MRPIKSKNLATSTTSELIIDRKRVIEFSIKLNELRKETHTRQTATRNWSTHCGKLIHTYTTATAINISLHNIFIKIATEFEDGIVCVCDCSGENNSLNHL